MQKLNALHPGLCEKVHAMFAECWPTKDVKQMLQAHYGERFSLSSLEKYKSKQWRAQRERIQEMSAALAASQELAGEARLGVR
jgi:hypothetical protein